MINFSQFPRYGFAAGQFAVYAIAGAVVTGVSVNGTVQSQSASATGAAAVQVAVSGTVSSQSATTTGTVEASNVRNVSGTVTSQRATASGAISVTIKASGTVASQSATTSGSVLSGAPSSLVVGSFFQNKGTTDLLDGSFLAAKRAEIGASAALEANDTFEILAGYALKYIGTGAYYRTRLDSDPVTLATVSPLAGGGILSADRSLSIGGLTGNGSPDSLVGVSANGGSWEYKVLVEGEGVTITHTKEQITIAAKGTTPMVDHDLLSSVHIDTVPGTVSRGDMIVGQEATAKWKKFALGKTGTILSSDGTDAKYQTLTELGIAKLLHGVDIGYVPYAVSNSEFAKTDMFCGASKIQIGITTDATTAKFVVNDPVVNAITRLYGNNIEFDRASNGASTIDKVDAGDLFFRMGTTNAEALRLKGSGKIGVNTSAPDLQLEINSATGDCLRLTYNDANGSAVKKCDLTVDVYGNLNIKPSSGETFVDSIGNKTVTLQTALGVEAVSSATVGAGFGVAVEFNATSTDGPTYNQTVLNSIWTDANFATRSSAMTFMTRNNGGTCLERLRVGPTGTLTYAYPVNEATTATKILTLDSSNNIDFRTPAELRVDLGAAAALSGTQYRVPRFATASTLGDSNIYTDAAGNCVGIGTGATVPIYKFMVEGAGTANESVARFNNQGDFSSKIWIRNSSRSAYLIVSGSTEDDSATGLLPYSFSMGISGTPSPIQFYNGDPGSVSAKVTILTNGYTGIGTNAPVSFVELRRTADDATHWLSLTCDGLTHGISSVLPTNAFFSIDTQDTSKGGATIMGATSENDRYPIMLFGILGATSGLGQTTAAINIRGSKQSGTSVTEIAATKPVVDFVNNNTLMGRFIGSGYFGINTSAPDKQIEINSATGDCLRLTYNVNNGSATYYSDFSVSNAGMLSIVAAGGIYTNELVGIGATPLSYGRLSLGYSSTWTTSEWLKSLYFNTTGSVMLWNKSSDNLYCGFGHTSNAFHWITSTAIDNSAAPGYPMILTNAGDLTLASIAHETTDVDKILVSSSGQLKYRTGSEILSDIGGAGVLSGTQYRIPRFATNSTLGDSNIYTNAAGTMVGIDTDSPLAKLQVNGTRVTSDGELIANEDLFILQKWENDPVQRMQVNFGLQKYEASNYGKSQLNISLWEESTLSAPVVSIRSNGNVGIGTVAPYRQLTNEKEDSSTVGDTAMLYLQRLTHKSTGGPGNGFGVGTEYCLENAYGHTYVAGTIDFQWLNAPGDPNKSEFNLRLLDSYDSFVAMKVNIDSTSIYGGESGGLFLNIESTAYYNTGINFYAVPFGGSRTLQQSIYYDYTNSTFMIGTENKKIKIGHASAQMGFYGGAVTAARAAHIANPSGGATTDAEARTAINAILAVLENVNLTASS